MILINIKTSVVKELLLAGYVLLGAGVFVFVLSVVTLRSKGVNHIADSGIYGIIRHPMYLGAMIMFFSHAFFGQSWMIIISTVIGMGCCYLSMLYEEQRNIEKFGNDYLRYMKRVPRMNALSGLARLIQSAK